MLEYGLLASKSYVGLSNFVNGIVNFWNAIPYELFWPAVGLITAFAFLIYRVVLGK